MLRLSIALGALALLLLSATASRAWFRPFGGAPAAAIPYLTDPSGTTLVDPSGYPLAPP
jgi:hypothetical protein